MPIPDQAEDDDDDNGPEVIAGPANSMAVHHAFAIGGAQHAYAGGHITKDQRDTIIKSARTALAKKKQAPNIRPPTNPVPATFGRLQPSVQATVPWREGSDSK
jgi:hypothetical protein